MVAFQCFYQGADLCFNGGTCVVNSTIQTCACPPGFTHDDTFGWFPNCAMPKGYLFGFFICHTVLSACSIVALCASLRGSKAQVRTLGFAFVWYVASLWALVLSVYVQNGMHTAALVTLIACIVGVVVFVALPVLQLIVKPMFVFNPRVRFEPFWNAMLTLSLSFMTMVVATIAAAVAYDNMLGQEVQYNTVCIVLLFEIVVSVFFMGSLVFVASYKFEGMLLEITNTSVQSNSATREGIKEAQRRLINMRRIAFALIIVLGMMLCPLPIVWATVKSIPFMYVFWSAAMLNAIGVTPLACFFLCAWDIPRFGGAVQSELSVPIGDGIGSGTVHSNTSTSDKKAALKRGSMI